MLVSLPSGVCETKRWAFWSSSTILVPPQPLGLWPIIVVRKSIVGVVHVYDFPKISTMGKRSHVPTYAGSSTRLTNADGASIKDRIVSASPVYYLSIGLTFISSIQMQVRQLWSEHHQAWFLGSEEPSEVPEAGDFDGYEANAEHESDWDLTDPTDGQDFSHHVAISVHYDQL